MVTISRFLLHFDDIIRDTSEDSEPEGTVPSGKELEESTKIEIATDLLSKSSLLEVEIKDAEKDTFAARDTLSKRHLLDMDMDTDETILVQTSLSSDWDPAPVVDIKTSVDASKIETVVDVEEVGAAVYHGSSCVWGPRYLFLHYRLLWTIRNACKYLLVKFW